MTHRARGLNNQGFMKEVMRNIKAEFKKLCVMVPKDKSRKKSDPNVPFEEKEWILLRTPWQPPLPDEHLIPKAPEEPPTWIVNRYKAVMSQWFFKDTLATPYSRVE